MTEDKPTVSEPLYDRDRLLAWMADQGIEQTTHDHPAVFRVEEGLELKASIQLRDWRPGIRSGGVAVIG